MTKFNCPCCDAQLEADDMDLSGAWKHSAAMKDRYGAACCTTCTDDHYLTEDGVAVADGERVLVAFGNVYSSAEARQDARIAADDEADLHRMCRMCRGWL